MAVVIETTVGDFTVDLYTEERPQTCRNFLKLCKIKYYNWNLFHSVQNNFIAQTGDPTGTGKGGESVYGIVLGEKARYYEAEKMPKIKHDRSGLLSMVSCGSNMLGSQFFITLAPELQSLDGEHCVFGEIAEGLEIILKFNETICDGDHRPYQDIRISHTVILEDPFEDPKGFVIPDRSPSPTKEVLMSDRIGADEVIDDTAGMTAEEITEMQKDKEAKARATILEIVGDIPDAEMAPPENVLFVCKLNPVTTDDDLEIIFSRFGKIIGCEVIRDRQTGDSLQYAFIEFADRKSCEDAYFKMDNVLIDDRRIHVDFSQSVAKMRWRGKGKGIQYFNDKPTDNKATRVTESDERNHTEIRKTKNNHKNEEKRRWDVDRRHKEGGYRKEDNEKDHTRNGGKYFDKDRYRDRNEYDKRDRERKRRDNRSPDKTGDRGRDKHRWKSPDRNRQRSRDRSDKLTKKDTHNDREHKHDRKPEKERKHRKSSSSDSEEERRSSHKKKRTKDRSEERHEKRTDSKHNRKKR